MPLHNGFSNIWNAVLADSYEDFYVIKNAGWNQDIPINGSVSFGMTSYEKFAGFPEYYTMLGKKVETKTSDYVVEYTVTDAWEDGLIGQIQITNMRDTAIEDWRLHFCYEGEIVDIWDGVILSHENGIYEISCEKYNQNIPAGASVTFGFKISSGDVGEPTDLVLEEYADGEETYIAVMGELTEEGIWLNTISSPLCETYTYYISLDGKDYSELEITDESEYLYKDTGDNDKRVYIYVAGKNKGEILKSENVIIEYAKGEYTITNYDTDGDLLCDYLEYCCDTDVRNKDTDGDGLTDYDEIYKTMTDPLLMDTDDDGISDYYMDIEGEGLQNWEELKNGTNPISSDTDEDNLTDYEELYVYGTDPLVADTDNDGLSDYDDVKLGFDPLLPDTDGNGILDGDEKVEQTVTYEFDNQEHPGVRAVSVTLTAAGNIEDKIYMEDMYGLDAMSSDVVGLYGIPVEIQCDVPFDTARLTFKYDESYLDGTEEDDLSIMWYNQAEEWYQILDEDCVIDKQENTVSYVTTHFSTYMLVRSSEWYNAWRENIDYRCSDENDTNKHYFDIAFVVDTSGSMSGRRMTATKTALNKFVDSMESADSAALIGFSGSAKKYCDFTSNKSSLKTGINNLKATGLTSVSAGMRVAVNMFKNRISLKERVMVLICDGDVDTVQPLVEECIKNKIKIYVLNISNKSTHFILEKMAKSTGGEYYYGDSSFDITTRMYEIQEITTDKIDTTDSDHDGLYDVFEKAGIKRPNGKVVYTNYLKIDTDGDGISDYNETGIVYNIDNRYIGKGTQKEVQYFKLRSDPTLKDTDFDGIDDKNDIRPWKKNTIVIAELDNKYNNSEYICIDEGNGSFAKGGNQDWWREKTMFEYKDSKIVNPFLYSIDYAYRIVKLGCGAIAMSDAELYCCIQKSYKPFCLDGEVEYNKETGVIDRCEYVDYVEDLFNGIYEINYNDAINYIGGLKPSTMESQFSIFLKLNGEKQKKS